MLISPKTITNKFKLARRGNFFIDCYNDEIISGLALDAATTGHYLWTFVLPAFDDISFLHFTLGRRITDLPLREIESSEIQTALNAIQEIRSSEELLSHVRGHDTFGEYGKWTEVLCSVRIQLKTASTQLAIPSHDFRLKSLAARMEQLNSVSTHEGRAGVSGLLEKWHNDTARRFGS